MGSKQSLKSDTQMLIESAALKFAIDSKVLEDIKDTSIQKHRLMLFHFLIRTFPEVLDPLDIKKLDTSRLSKCFVFMSILFYGGGEYAVRRIFKQQSAPLKMLPLICCIGILGAGQFIIFPGYKQWVIKRLYEKYKENLTEEKLKTAFCARSSMLFFNYDSV